MKDETKKRSEEVALFRYGLIADLTHLEVGAKGLYKLLEEKSAKDYCIPGSSRTRVAEETLRTWLRQYRRFGFEALKPKPRSDTGSTRALPQEVKDLWLISRICGRIGYENRGVFRANDRGQPRSRGRSGIRTPFS